MERDNNIHIFVCYVLFHATDFFRLKFNTMFRIIQCLGFMLFLAISCTQVPSAVYYVSASGDDSNPGSKEKPLATLEAARDRVRTYRQSSPSPGYIEIIIEEGVYPICQPVTFGPEDTAPDKSPLFVRGEGKVLFEGGKTLPPFEKVSDRLWKITLPGAVYEEGLIQQLYVNGEKATRARTPNTGFFITRKEIMEKIDSSGTAPFAIQEIKLTKEQLDSLPAEHTDGLLIAINHAWDQTRKYVRKISKRDSTLSIDGKPMKPWNKLGNSSQFILENSRAFLDMPGEWFLDKEHVLYYIPRQGEQIETTTAIVPVAQNFLLIAGTEDQPVENIHFENLSFRYTRYIMSDAGDEPEQAAASTDASVMIDCARNIEFRNCEIAHTGNNGIWFRRACSDCLVSHSYLHDLGIGGVKIGEKKIPENEELLTKHITVDNTIIRSGGREIPTGIGVLIFQASDNTISHNEIADFFYSGVSVGWIWGYADSPSKRNKIIYNHIHGLGQGALSDMGGVYTLGKSEGTVVSNNVIHDIYSYGYGGWGLYTDEGSTGILLEKNLVYNCKSSGFHQHYGENNIIRNNIFAFNKLAQLEATRVEDHTSFTFTNNIIFFNGDKIFEATGVAGWTNWEKVKAVEDQNCFWSTQTKDIVFGNKKIDEWRTATGKDLNSITEDPGFVNPGEYDFNFKDNSVIKKISFAPFDYSEAGVYGDNEWKELGKFNKKYTIFAAEQK